MSYRDPLITLSNHTAKFNLGDNRKSDTNQRFCYLFMLIFYFVEHHQDLIKTWIRSRLNHLHAHWPHSSREDWEEVKAA